MNEVAPARLNPALREFWKTKADIKVLKGGRASGKSWDAAGFAVYLASMYCVKFLFVRQFQNRLSDSMHALLLTQIERFGLQNQFVVNNSIIKNTRTGSECYFYGVNRNLSEIKGFEGADILIFDEAEGLSKDQWEIIEPTIRKEGSEIWIIYNPRLIGDFVESNFKHSPSDGVIVRHINYTENQFLSQSMLRKIDRLKASNHEEYEHIYLGVPRTDDDSAVIKRSWIEAAIDAHKALGISPTGSRRVGFDVADSGSDLCAMVSSHGILALSGDQWQGKEDELLQSCTRVYAAAVESRSEIVYDSIGVGASAGSIFKKMNSDRKQSGTGGQCKYSKFVAGAKVANPDQFYVSSGDEKIKNKDYFSNLKAQAWWLVADRFRNTYNAVKNGEKFGDDELISISSDFPQLDILVAELSTPWRRFDNLGRVKVESKDDLIKRGVKSPNYADAFIMSFAPVEQAKIAVAW